MNSSKKNKNAVQNASTVCWMNGSSVKFRQKKEDGSSTPKWLYSIAVTGNSVVAYFRSVRDSESITQQFAFARFHHWGLSKKGSLQVFLFFVFDNYLYYTSIHMEFKPCLKEYS
ncbi:MAG: hypothetical protein MZU97_04405 [Bacillus subtilis]|nr:hypothetical protein [Bacillus subtilis]